MTLKLKKEKRESEKKNFIKQRKKYHSTKLFAYSRMYDMNVMKRYKVL